MKEVEQYTHSIPYDIVNNPDNILMAFQDLKPEKFGGLSNAKTLELQPGQASFHSGKIVHGSGPNTSSNRRAGFSIQIIPTHVELEPYKYETLDSKNNVQSDWRDPIVIQGVDALAEKRPNGPFKSKPDFLYPQ